MYLLMVDSYITIIMITGMTSHFTDSQLETCVGRFMQPDGVTAMSVTIMEAMLYPCCLMLSMGACLHLVRPSTRGSS